VSQPSQPKYLGMAPSPRYHFSGSAQGKYLYTGVISTKRGEQNGISVWDISDPAKPREIEFVSTPEYLEEKDHLFAVGKNVLLAAVGYGGLHIGSKVHGSAALFDLSNPEKPVLVGSFAEAGGRTAAVHRTSSGTFLVCNGWIFEVGQQRQTTVQEFSGGSTLDGAPYHGDTQGPYVAIATDDEAIVVRIRAGAGDKSPVNPGSVSYSLETQGIVEPVP